MRALVTAKVAMLDGVREGTGLVKAEAQPFAGDGIDASRGIAYQGHAAALDSAQGVHRRDCSAFGADGNRASNSFAQVRERAQSGIDAKLRIVRHHRNTHLIRAERGDIRLTVITPVHFHSRRPRRYLEVAAIGIAAAVMRAGVQPGPMANARAGSIRADDPVR